MSQAGVLARLPLNQWVPGDTFKDSLDVLFVFSLISKGDVQYRRRWFRRGKWMRRVK